MKELHVERGEVGRWPKRKARQGDKETGRPLPLQGNQDRQGDKRRSLSRRKVIKKAAAAVAGLRFAGFVVWSDPDLDSRINLSDEHEEGT